MAAMRTWAFLLLWFRMSTQEKKTDVHVTCVFSEDCVLPCSFQPSSDQVIRWLRQEVVIYTLRLRDGEDGEDDEDDKDDRSEHEQYDGRASLFPNLVSHGNASLRLTHCGPRDRGRYRCQVNSTAGLHEAQVIVRVEAPVRSLSLSLELSRLDGYEDLKCATRDVYPAPQIAWATDPPTAGGLRPNTRMLADERGQYNVESRLRKLKDQSQLTYICQVNSSYGTQVWTASLTERAINWTERRNLTIPCHAPPHFPNPSLSWSFTNHNKPAIILTYNSKAQQSSVSTLWKERVVLDPAKVASGDGSLWLLEPDRLEHSGVYTCVYASLRTTHTIVTRVTMTSDSGETKYLAGESNWWIVGLVIALLALALVGILGYLKIKGDQPKPSKMVEEASEMHPVRGDPVNAEPGEDSVLTADESNRHS
ncbi:CD276 antigen-like [Hypomesus transpacificus]|uniref:CD276 antigen-like n=1 Tax=Hypomesus transpacificus TaxID=137520 RepID=UPI001F0847B0|nr:CD276 antigen-like [Hypomesus transpacificus]XP_046880423.1 CD276 antigen-like [Hypomesus transpacificus]XP_046880424.1 CD276 antigen-like [Hypomesus transpacificus]XP_046880425.1 CD276 antigen-like [Hypomesus transpacificus]XP_046880426.1 CD276 antigen-like [Hypomesus transpacificus]XP_046880428.1 CD276 antigen-like [Hypomesus transpacificus]XP_046880429.1 CD276 antigen-like [Hypomesus transpacificus]